MANSVSWGQETIRINPSDPNKLESSQDGIRWTERFCGNRSVGEFYSISEDGSSLIATTNHGDFFGASNGSMWFVDVREH